MSHDNRNHRHTVTPTAPPLHLCDDTFSYVKYSNGPVHTDNSSHHGHHAPSKHAPPPDTVDDEPEPSAPPLELMDKVRGYESASFEAVAIPPPLETSLKKSDSETHRSPLPSIPHLTEKEAREALLKEVSTHCCYGKAAARDMAITEIKHSMAFHDINCELLGVAASLCFDAVLLTDGIYTLETFTEKRTTCWAFEPYNGGPVERLDSGEAPFPWDVPSLPPSYFKNHALQLEVPYTASIKVCHVCGGPGRKRCNTCSGKGHEYCYHCHGDGFAPVALRSATKDCLYCTGSGQRKCWKCGGEGIALCKVCSGTGQIRCFIRLTIKWTNHMDDHVVEKISNLDDDKIRNVSGEVVCQEEETSLLPLTHFPDTTVSMASAQLLQNHGSSFPEEKVLKQRHKVSIVPVASVHYKWKNREGLFHVYGFEQRVYTPDYPQTCCCCCIL